MSIASFCFRSGRTVQALRRVAQTSRFQAVPTRHFHQSPPAFFRGPKFRVHNEDTDLPLASSDDDDRQPRKYVFVSDDDERLFEDDSIGDDGGDDAFEFSPDDDNLVQEALWSHVDDTGNVDRVDPDRHFAEWKAMAQQHERVRTEGVKWAEVALEISRQLLSFPPLDALTLHSFGVNVGRRLVYITLDKFVDAYGSPSMDEISLFSTRLMERLSDALGAAVAESLQFEVSSPGAERVVRLPFELSRFQHLPMKVLYQLSDTSGDRKTATKVLEFIRQDSELTFWKNWKRGTPEEGRRRSKKNSKLRYGIDLDQEMKIPVHDLLHVHLYLDL